MIDPQDLISKLKAQHRLLQSDLSLVLDDANPEAERDYGNTVLKLTKFKDDLFEHLKLENEALYPDYLDKKRKKGEDITDSTEFIKRMDDIGKAVMDFLGKYNTAEAIEAALLDFRKELTDVIGTLNVRIETEEEGVFGSYLLM